MRKVDRSGHGSIVICRRGFRDRDCTFRAADGLWKAIGSRIATPDALSPQPGPGPQFYDARRPRSAETSDPTPRTSSWRGSTSQCPGRTLLVTARMSTLCTTCGVRAAIAAHSRRLNSVGAGFRRAFTVPADVPPQTVRPYPSRDCRPLVHDKLRARNPSRRKLKSLSLSVALETRCGPTSGVAAIFRTRWSRSRRRCVAAFSCRSVRRSGDPPRVRPDRAKYWRGTLELNMSRARQYLFPRKPHGLVKVIWYLPG